MGKRKRDVVEYANAMAAPAQEVGSESLANTGRPARSTTTLARHQIKPSRSVQIVTGSYERALHGVTATLAPRTVHDEAATNRVSFADTFLFNAHSSAIRCLAVSPSQPNDATNGAQKVILATGGTDDRINLYHLAASTSSAHARRPSMVAATHCLVMENPNNRELGSLLHHSSSITALSFPTRSKLISSAEDNTISVTRTRDFTVLRSIKAPLPPAHGRPSGDTAPPGGKPSGVNDFAVHPTGKLMLSVGKGEKCMRLWNLVTGKKAGVLNFGRDILQAVREGKWSTGEARKVVWNGSGEEFAVGFERGVVVFGIDCKPKCLVYPSPPSKVQQIQYIAIPEPKASALGQGFEEIHVLAVSTEDGRVIFFSTLVEDRKPSNGQASNVHIPTARALGELGGQSMGMSTRIKDFAVLQMALDAENADLRNSVLVIAGTSDGAICLWNVTDIELLEASRRKASDLPTRDHLSVSGEGQMATQSESLATQMGELLGTYETGNRITCLTAFLLRDDASVDDEDGTLAEQENGQDSSNGGSESN